jgi:hypothetical protein
MFVVWDERVKDVLRGGLGSTPGKNWKGRSPLP